MKKLLSILLLSAFIKLSAATGEIVTHKVQEGENLFRISLMYNSTIDDITAANPSTNLKAVKQGMTINVPKDTKVRDAAFVANILNNKSGSTATVPAATPAPVVKPIVAPKPQSKPAMAEATPTKQKEITKTADKREAVKEESAFISIAALAKPVAASPK